MYNINLIEYVSFLENGKFTFINYLIYKNMDYHVNDWSATVLTTYTFRFKLFMKRYKVGKDQEKAQSENKDCHSKKPRWEKLK